MEILWKRTIYEKFRANCRLQGKISVFYVAEVIYNFTFFFSEYYLKVTVFIAGTKYKSYKSSIAKASPNLNFKEKFIVPLSSEQLKDTSFVFQLYMKHISKKMLTNKMLTGKTIIGPYMKHGERSFSQWEKVITKPMEEITETHILYL